MGKIYWSEKGEIMSRNATTDKKKLLAKLAKTPIIEVACKQTGVPRSTYYRWRKNDENFANACDEAIEHSAELINDLAESQLIAAIKDKKMSAITFWLKHHHRAYGTKIELNANIQHIQQSLTDEQRLIVSEALRLAGLIESRGQDDKN